MPARSKVAMLPVEVRSELERRIVERAFSGYEELAEWLQAQGYQIAEDSVQRYGSRLQHKLEAMDRAAHQAKAIAEAAPHGGETILDATIQLIHERAFSALVEAEQLEQSDMMRLARTLADLSRITIARQRWAEELKSRLDRQKQAASERLANTERKGLTKEAYHAIRNALLGIDPFAPGAATTASEHPGVLPAAANPANDIDGAEAAKPGTPRG